MATKTFVLLLAFVSSLVVANPVLVNRAPITLPVSARFNISGTVKLVERDLARVQALRARAESKAHDGKRAVISSPVDNQAVTYIAEVGVGSPATTYSLIVDTGSSNTWVGSGRSYVRTSTSTQTSNRVSVTYGSGSFSGTEFTDQVTIASGLVIPSQSIGVASTSSGFDGVDGILGIGPVDLTLGTLSPATGTLIPTVTDNLFSQGTITANEIGVFFAPSNQIESVNGEITWGGTDASKLTGAVSFTPVTSTSPASEFWGINQTIRYGASTSILTSTAGIVDTGTTLLLLSSDAFARYRTATGAVADNATGLLRITAAQFANLQSLFFTISGVTYEFTANAQIWPRALNTAIGGNANSIYLITASLGTPTGQGFDFVNGFAFLERFYSVYDTANHRVGFATTAQTTSTIN